MVKLMILLSFHWCAHVSMRTHNIWFTCIAFVKRSGALTSGFKRGKWLSRQRDCSLALAHGRLGASFGLKNHRDFAQNIGHDNLWDRPLNEFDRHQFAGGLIPVKQRLPCSPLAQRFHVLEHISQPDVYFFLFPNCRLGSRCGCSLGLAAAGTTHINRDTVSV